jgi:hypothetical protein
MQELSSAIQIFYRKVTIDIEAFVAGQELVK